jgi:uncharacterized delta-60 repeat protein
VRCNADGSVDTGFGTDGITIVESRASAARAVSRSGGGYFLVPHGPLNNSIEVFALDSAGQLDASFGLGGRNSVEIGGSGGYDLLALDDGRLLIASSALGDLYEQMLVCCLRADGLADPSFGADGRFVLPGQGRAVKLLADGDGVLVAGSHFDPATGTDVVLLRLLP